VRCLKLNVARYVGYYALSSAEYHAVSSGGADPFSGVQAWVLAVLLVWDSMALVWVACQAEAWAVVGLAQERLCVRST